MAGQLIMPCSFESSDCFDKALMATKPFTDGGLRHGEHHHRGALTHSDTQRNPEHCMLQYPLHVGYSFSFLQSTVRIRWWHLPTAQMIDTCENGAELCTYTNIYPHVYIHTYIHTYIILTQYKTFSRNSCPRLAPMWNYNTLSYLCDPVESSKGVPYPHSAV